MLSYSCHRNTKTGLFLLFLADTLKTEVPELDGLGYMEDVSESLGNLLSSPLKEIKCVESIVFSSLNPPPSYRRYKDFSSVINIIL